VEFFAVTTTSVYLVSDQRGDQGFPIIEKIAQMQPSSVAVGQRFKNGRLVGIGRYGIVLYDEDHPNSNGQPRQCADEVNLAFWGGHTSSVIALFLRKEEAMECSSCEALQNCDKRWQSQTEETLKALDGNGMFVLSRLESISF